MPRNGSGSYSLPLTFTANTDATAEDVNQQFDDIADEIQNSVAADGQTTLTGALKGAAGTVAAPGYGFAADPDCGLYRIGANNLGIAANGAKVLDIATTGLTITGVLGASGQILSADGSVAAPGYAFTNDIDCGWYRIGANNFGFACNGAKVLDVATTGLAVTGALSASGNATVTGSVTAGSLAGTAATPRRGYIDGCILSNNLADATNDIDIAAGVCRDSTNAVDIIVAAMTKRLDGDWAAGTNQGMRYSGAAIANTTYHIYAAMKADGTQDFYADPSATAATALAHLQAETGGASYAYVRRIGAILREGGTIVPFAQRGDYFLRKTLASTIVAGNPGTSAVTRTMAVPTGIKVFGDFILNVYNTAGGGVCYGLLTDLDAADDAPSATLTQAYGSSNNLSGSAPVQVWTNTSGQIRSRISFSDVNTGLRIIDRGWTDLRGKDE